MGLFFYSSYDIKIILKLISQLKTVDILSYICDVIMGIVFIELPKYNLLVIYSLFDTCHLITTCTLSYDTFMLLLLIV